MEGSNNLSERPEDLVQKKKNKRWGPKLNNFTALKRSALRKQGGPNSHGNEQLMAKFNLFNNKDVPLEFCGNVEV